MHINASKTTAMPALIPVEQRQTGLLNGEPLEVVDNVKYLDSMFMINNEGTEDIRSRSFRTFLLEILCLLTA